MYGFEALVIRLVFLSESADISSKDEEEMRPSSLNKLNISLIDKRR